jgi:hypothetical protein
MQTNILPRQARDKHRESSKKDRFSRSSPAQWMSWTQAIARLGLGSLDQAAGLRSSASLLGACGNWRQVLCVRLRVSVCPEPVLASCQLLSFLNQRRLRLRPVLSHLYIKTNILPRQARDKHRENSKKVRFSSPVVMRTALRSQGSVARRR